MFQPGDRVRHIAGRGCNPDRIGYTGIVEKKDGNYHYLIPDGTETSIDFRGLWTTRNLELVLSEKEPEMTIPDYLFQREDDI